MIVLLSGPIAAGKSTVARGLSQNLGWPTIQVRKALQKRLGAADLDRQQLQRLGGELDRRTRGRWLGDYLEELGTSDLIVDSLRTRRQTLPLLDHFVDSRLIFISAHEETRRRRYASAAAQDGVKRSVAFDEAMAHETETEVFKLGALAHLQIDTDEMTARETVNAILQHVAG